MARSASTWAERATGDTLISPDWSINMELCDAINKNPWQAKDALKVIKKRLGSKRPIIQLLALSVLDALIKNCGDNVIQQVIDRQILSEMSTIVKKKPNIDVREKILVLIDTWQEAIGVKFPQFIQTFYSLRDSGIGFPAREESSVTLFASAQVKPSGHSSNLKKVATPASLEDDITPICMAEMKTAEELADVLMQMLDVLDPTNRQAINQELIVDMTEECQGYQKRIQSLVNNTSDESLLLKGLAVNDSLQRVLSRCEEIANGNTFTAPVQESSAPLFIGVSHQEKEAEYDFPHLAPRSQARRSTPNNEATHGIPSFSKMPNPPTDGAMDYLCEDLYKSDRPFGTSYSSSGFKPPSAPPSPFRYDKQAMYEEPTSLASHPHSPAKNEGTYDNFFLSRHSTPARDKETEDALFRDLVDFANARASPSSSTSKSSRSYRD